MNKLVKGLICAGIGGTLLFAAGCNGCSKKTWDTETRPLALSTGAVDGNFNPFFYTALNDSNMIANTQISMLTIDEKGKLVCGQNQPTVVLDYKSTMYNTKEVGTGSVTTAGSKDGRTEYEFVIKNGIKFSDGQSLDIYDVLFNLYVYLDPSYTGSATIYSTDIQGLKSYRAQRPDLKDDSTEDTESGFVSTAQTRINALIEWSNDSSKNDDDLTAEQAADLEKVRDALRKELETDWTSTESSWKETYKDTHHFTETWQAYLYEHGVISDQMKPVQTGSGSVKYKDADGFTYTTLDYWQPSAVGGGRDDERGAQAHIDAIASKSNNEQIKTYCINTVFDTLSYQKKIAEVLTFWGTAQTILDDFTNEARAAYFQTLPEGQRVASISGITYENVSGSSLSSFGGEMGETYVANQTYSVLKIVINGVDPKAVYNFSFPVAPLHYYSGEYKGVNYAEEAKKGNGFGVLVGDPDFIKKVLQDPAKSGVPVGAGPYIAADMNGNPTKDRNKFRDGTIISFVRNDNFESVGTGIENAKIRMVQYKELNSDGDIMNGLTTQTIDFAMPNATPTNVTTIGNNKDFLESTSYRTGGYGYIGINPKFIPEVYVRQAIMKAMNTKQTAAYYGSEFAEPLYRPMTMTSWAYPDEVKTAYPDVAYTTNEDEITQLVEDAGYTLVNGVYTKTKNVNGITNAPEGTKLKFPFTIAGDTTDHPAYQMLRNAANKLNELGFDIVVKTSSTALQDLATGNLEVWAAAWSSSVDPDPYQVYHKDSNATSVLNWNYKNILNDTQKWDYEYTRVRAISDLIDDGRSTTDQSTRKRIYAQCLDKIMELAVELPTYQRKDLCVYNKNVIDGNSLVKEPSFNMGLFDKLWEIDYV